MPWTAMHWVVFCLLCVCALQSVVIVHLLDHRPRRRTPVQPVYLPTARMIEQWKAEQLVATTPNRKRA